MGSEEDRRGMQKEVKGEGGACRRKERDEEISHKVQKQEKGRFQLGCEWGPIRNSLLSERGGSETAAMGRKSMCYSFEGRGY